MEAHVALLRRFRGMFDLDQERFYGVFDTAEGRVLGEVGLLTHAGRGARELAYWVRADVAGKGYATEMATAGLALGFAELALTEIVAFTLPHNVASRTVMARLGMTYVRDCLHAGMPHVVYSIRGDR